MSTTNYDMSPESYRHASSEYRREARRFGLAAAACFLLGAASCAYASAWTFLCFAGTAGLWSCAMTSMGRASDLARHAALLEEGRECRDVR